MKHLRFGLFIELVVQFIWTTFLIILLLPRNGGSIAARFISPGYFWLLYISIIFFALFMFVTLYKMISGSSGGPTKNAFLYLLIPIMLFPVAREAQLGASAVNRREVKSILSEAADVNDKPADSNTGTDPAANANPVSTPSYTRISRPNEDGTTRLTDILTNDEQFIGTDVEVIGKAAFNELLPSGSFYLYRFIIFCCAADATPAGLIVSGYEPETIVEDRWYRLKGKVGLFDVDGKGYMSIEAESIEEIEAPVNPYEYYY